MKVIAARLHPAHTPRNHQTRPPGVPRKELREARHQIILPVNVVVCITGGKTFRSEVQAADGILCSVLKVTATKATKIFHIAQRIGGGVPAGFHAE